MTPRILFNDKDLSRTDIDLLSLIISLTFNSNYCYANNKYLSEYINTSKRTISDSLSKLKRLEYIKVKSVNNQRRIYLNTEKIPIKTATKVAKNRNKSIEENCYYNINNYENNNYKVNNFKRTGIVPKWLSNPELCKTEPLDDETRIEIEKILEEFK